MEIKGQTFLSIWGLYYSPRMYETTTKKDPQSNSTEPISHPQLHKNMTTGLTQQTDDALDEKTGPLTLG